MDILKELKHETTTVVGIATTHETTTTVVELPEHLVGIATTHETTTTVDCLELPEHLTSELPVHLVGIATTHETTTTVDWLELPEHLTSIILSKITSIADYIRFSAVCTKWLSILLTDIDENFPKSFPPQLPLLMIPTPSSLISKEKKKKKNKKKSGSSDTISCSFYQVTDEKILNRLQLTMPRDRYVRGSSHGWLITIDDLFFSIQLINPFFYPNASTKVIKLPPLTAFPSCENPDHLRYLHLRTMVLSADPMSNPKDFVVLTIYSAFMRLAFWKPGDKAWTPIISNLKGGFQDIIYYEDKFYAVNYGGTIVVVDVATRTTTTFSPPPKTELCSKNYLVASAGELFNVRRKVVGNNGDSIGFEVFKLQRIEKEATEWMKVKDLGNRVFFVGDNVSLSISASDFAGCKPNCIYYTDDNIEHYFHDPKCGPHDMGVFNLENESFDKHYPTDVNARIWPAPIWIEPTLPRSIARLKRLRIA